MSNDRFIKDEIGETLLITLYMKYKESQKPNPIISDDNACELVKKIDYDFSKFDKAISSSVGVAIRSNYFDNITKKFIQLNENPVIIQVGCGLDSRYNRIGEIAKKAKFYELDIPEVMRIREKLIPKKDNETYIHASMLETNWMDNIKAENPKANFLFIVEGVFMYFSKEDVKKFFVNLSDRFSNGEIVFDVINKWMSENSHIHDTVKVTRTKFIYGTDDDKEMEKWVDNLNLISSKTISDFPEWKRAGIKGWIIRIIPKFKKAGRLLYYKIS